MSRIHHRLDLLAQQGPLGALFWTICTCGWASDRGSQDQAEEQAWGHVEGQQSVCLGGLGGWDVA